jgi:hypothetical protein
MSICLAKPVLTQDMFRHTTLRHHLIAFMLIWVPLPVFQRFVARLYDQLAMLIASRLSAWIGDDSGFLQGGIGGGTNPHLRGRAQAWALMQT